VPLVAAAICPSPPLIVPQLAAGAARELDDVRAACDAAVARVLAAEPDLLVVVGVGGTTGELPPPYRGSFAPWGVPVQVSLDGAAHSTAPIMEKPARIGDQTTPITPRSTVMGLAPLVGLWLLGRQGQSARVRVWTVDSDADPGVCHRLGEEISAAGRVGLLVVGDGAACHGPKAPGYADADAGPFDEEVRAAFDAGDPAGLRTLDPARASRLHATGRAPWQVLAGAAGAGCRKSEVSYAVPYGVGYFAVSWT
jgi:hypothetical protein